MEDETKPTFSELLERAAREAAAHATGNGEPSGDAKVTWRTLTARHIRLRPPSAPSAGRIREIRHSLDLSQAVFAALLNVSASTIRAWEQGQRTPKGPSLRLLEIAEHHPTALLIMADRSATRSDRNAAADQGADQEAPSDPQRAPPEPGSAEEVDEPSHREAERRVTFGG